jgi:hypothetical protein
LNGLIAKQIVQADAEGIYIGNIHTIEADLELQERGQGGAAITMNLYWTGAISFLIIIPILENVTHISKFNNI